jgi:hypothetical protein
MDPSSNTSNAGSIAVTLASAMLLDGRVYSLSATWIVSPSSHDLRV